MEQLPPFPKSEKAKTKYVSHKGTKYTKLLGGLCVFVGQKSCHEYTNPVLIQSVISFLFPSCINS